MAPRTLSQWLDWQSQINWRRIDLGLDRVNSVWQRMGKPRAPLTLTVGGTNGKGSTVAFLDAMLQAMGYRVGAYTSPHIVRYNERIGINGVPVSDALLCDSFARIEAARQDTRLTYFEFGTLAALDIFQREKVDVMVLEVGLGGRLDATNIVDADVAAITTIALDHTQFLGPDKDSIGREKAGIARAHRPVIVGDTNPPNGLCQMLDQIGAKVEYTGTAFCLKGQVWIHQDGTEFALPTLAFEGRYQQQNAATALAVLHALKDRIPWSGHAMAKGLQRAQLQGRLQRLGTAPERFVDVAHNVQAASALASWLTTHRPSGRVYAVFGALADKDVANVIKILANTIDKWHLGGLEHRTERGLPETRLTSQFVTVLPDAAYSTSHTIESAWAHALQEAGNDDLVIAFGSFFVVSAVFTVENTKKVRAGTE